MTESLDINCFNVFASFAAIVILLDRFLLSRGVNYIYNNVFWYRKDGG
jgi:hypothetical protein